MAEVARGVDLEAEPERAQPRLHRRERARGAPATGGGIDDERDLACHVGAHLDHPDSRMNLSTSSGRSVIT